MLPAVGQQASGVGAALSERRAVLGTGRGLEPRGVVPGRGGTGQRQGFAHAGAGVGQPRIQFGFDLASGRFGVLRSPLAHAVRDRLG